MASRPLLRSQRIVHHCLRQGALHAVDDCGAVGDGVADDAGALQRCLDAPPRNRSRRGGGAPVVLVLPKGVYLVGRALQMPEDAALVGIAHHLSIVTAPAGGVAGAPTHATHATPPRPVLRTGAGRTWLRGLCVDATASENASGTFPALWRSRDARSSMRDFRTRLNVPGARAPGGGPFEPTFLPLPFAQLVIAGNGRVQNWMDDMGCFANKRQAKVGIS